MKIGAVCEQTGLTDRTVRYYTEEGLLNPSFTKNYLGRKTFDFSEEDVAMLKDIAVLRKYGFSIPEIKSILEDPAKSVEIIEALRQKKQETIQSEQELLDVLLTLEKGKPYTVPELAGALNTPKLEETELPEEPDDGCFLAICKALFWLMCGPITVLWIFSVPFTIWEWLENYRYIKLYPWFDKWLLSSFGLCIPVLAFGAMCVLEMKRGIMDAKLRRVLTVLLILCYATFGNVLFIFSIPIPIFEGGFYSETVDPSNYMVLGRMEKHKLGEELEKMFPEQIPEYALGEHGQPCPDTTRYYNYVNGNWDQIFELHAQWKLTTEDLETEKKRIQDIFTTEITAQGHMGEWEYWSIQMDPSPCIADERYYEYGYSGHNFLFFACHEETGMVRYVASYASAGFYVPGFLALDWN